VVSSNECSNESDAWEARRRLCSIKIRYSETVHESFMQIGVQLDVCAVKVGHEWTVVQRRQAPLTRHSNAVVDK